MFRVSRSSNLPIRGAALAAFAAAWLALSPPAAAAELEGGGIAFHLGAELPVEALAWAEEVVVDPTRARPADVAALRARGAIVLARVTLGRAGARAPQIAQAPALARAGYGGFFVDDLDRVPSGEAMSAVIALRDGVPGTLIYGRGAPEPLSWFRRAMAGLVLESQLTRTDGQRPRLATAAERAAAEAYIDSLRARAGGRIVVVEHAPDRESARVVARALADRGLMPWVAVGPGLDAPGVGLREAVPRRLLAVYDGAEEAFLPRVLVHHLGAVVLEHLGYALDYVDVRQGLPVGDLRNRWAGIVTWFTDDDMEVADRYQRWLLAAMDGGMRVAVLGRMGFRAPPTLLARLGMTPVADLLKAPVTVRRAGEMIGFEARPRPRARDVNAWRTKDGAAHLELADAAGRIVTPVVTARWGGLALDPFLLEHGFGGRVRWIVDPFAFVREALALPSLPLPDVTTENGLRMLEVHIDGDGFASRAEVPGAPFSGEIVLDKFLRRYPFPTTVSIIEGEIATTGLYPHLADRLEGIARQIFREPSVEAASHSYSHPFDWLRAAGKGASPGEEAEITGDPVNLPIPNYVYDVKREVLGSVEYINKRLAPPDRPVRTFLWSGSALPDEDALAAAYAARITNMNGSNAENIHDEPSLAQVPALGRKVGGLLQVYAPAHNENLYTNEWRGPFYGFRDVIKMFDFTEVPRRLKPISIYYHFYSGTKPAAINALDEVYRWAMRQETLPLWVSEFVVRAAEFDGVTMARRLDGALEVRGMRHLRTLRHGPELGWPDLARSRDVIGMRELPQGRYVALGGAGDARVVFAPSPPAGAPYLVSANAPAARWEATGNTVTLRLRGHLPVKARLGGCTDMAVSGGARPRVSRIAGRVELVFSAKDTGDVTVRCR